MKKANTTPSHLTNQLKYGLMSALLAGGAFTMLGQAPIASAAQVSHGSSVYGKLQNRYTEEKLSDDEIFERAQKEDLGYGDFDKINERIRNGEDIPENTPTNTYNNATQEPTYPEVDQSSDFHGGSVYGKLRLRYTEEKLSDDEIYERSQKEDLGYGDFDKINERIRNGEDTPENTPTSTYNNATQEPTYPEVNQSSDFHGGSVYGKLRLRYTEEKLSDDEIYERSQKEDLGYGDFDKINQEILNGQAGSDLDENLDESIV